MKTTYEVFLLSLGFLSVTVTTAHASTVQHISAAEAETGRAPLLNVCPIQGYNLNFLKIKGGIIHAKLVDPSRTHVSFDVSTPSYQTPATVVYLRQIDPLNFRGLPAAKKGQATTLSVLTKNRKLYRFRVAHSCPSTHDTGIVTEPIARRPRRFEPVQQIEPIEEVKGKDPVFPKPNARVSQGSEHIDIPVPEPAPPAQPPALTFDNQIIIEGNLNNLYGLPESRPIDPPQVIQTPSQDEVGLVPSPPVETTYASEYNPELTNSAIAYYLTRGLFKAGQAGHINRGTTQYRLWNSIIRRVRKDQDLTTAIQTVAPVGELKDFQRIGKNLLSMGGLK